MSDLEKAARMALKTLEYIDLQDHDRDFLSYKECHDLDEAITALRQALEQPQDEWLTGCPECGMDGECGCDKKSEPAQQQEPVAWKHPVTADVFSTYAMAKKACCVGQEPIPLYTSPQRKPVDWEAVAADQAMTIAMMKAEQEAAVLAEREACAQICDDRDMGDCNREDMEARACAAAIRARKTP